MFYMPLIWMLKFTTLSDCNSFWALIVILDTYFRPFIQTFFVCIRRAHRQAQSNMPSQFQSWGHKIGYAFCCHIYIETNYSHNITPEIVMCECYHEKKIVLEILSDKNIYILITNTNLYRNDEQRN